MFKKMLSSLGIDAPSVDTKLATPTVQPGGVVRGDVGVEGGGADVEIEYVTLGLVTQIESEHGDHEWKSNVEFFRAEVSRSFKLAAKERKAIPFEIPVPWETPVTEVYGQHLHGMAMGVRTELSIAKSVDKGDLDRLSIAPMPSQLRILEAFEQLGFRFKGADLEQGRLHGVRQELPFFQEIEFYPPHHVHGVNEVELTFVANPHTLDVILEVDRRGGFLSGGGDTYRRFTVSHDEVENMDWAHELNAWIAHAGSHSSHGLHGHGGYGHRLSSFGHGGGHYGHDDHHGHGGHRRGPGWGAVAGGAAAGVAGGFVAGEVIDEVFEDEEE